MTYLVVSICWTFKREGGHKLGQFWEGITKINDHSSLGPRFRVNYSIRHCCWSPFNKWGVTFLKKQARRDPSKEIRTLSSVLIHDFDCLYSCTRSDLHAWNSGKPRFYLSSSSIFFCKRIPTHTWRSVPPAIQPTNLPDDREENPIYSARSIDRQASGFSNVSCTFLHTNQPPGKWVVRFRNCNCRPNGGGCKNSPSPRSHNNGDGNKHAVFGFCYWRGWLT